MTESERLPRIVTTALDALDLPYQMEHGILHVDIPPEVSHHFGRRRKVSLTFDPDIWAIDRSLDLIVPGSQILEALEESLKDRGAVQAMWVGGQLAGSPDLQKAWESRFQVRGGTLAAIRGQSPQKRYLRQVYEVRLPSSPPRTELIPIVWDIDQEKVLPPQQQGSLLAQTWYGQEEALGVLPDDLSHPTTSTLTFAEKMVVDALQNRVAQAVNELQMERKRSADLELKELQRDRKRRIRDADPDQIDAIREEFSRRKSRLLAWQNSQAEASLLSSTLLFSFSYILQLEYTHTASQQKILITPRQRAGQLLDAQCLWCDDVAPGGVLLLRAVPDEHPLVCIRCGRACADSTCGEVVRLQTHHISCDHCGEDFKYCSKHDVLCPICSQHVCPDHRQMASCCNETVCHTHLHPHGQDKTRFLCTRHSRQCSIDQAWFPTQQMTQCPVSQKWLQQSHAKSPPGDPRRLHPDAILTCASSGMKIARDRAYRCANDKQWHHPSEIERCSQTNGFLCPKHRIQTTWKPTLLIDIRRRRLCSETKHTIDVSQAGICSVTGLTFHKSRLIQCPVTKKWLNHSKARVAPEDPTLRVHPEAIVRCALTNRLMIKTLARRDELTDLFPVHPTALSRCALSGKQTAKRHLIKLSCCGRMAARIPEKPQVMSRLIGLGGGKWVCTDHYGMCTDGPHPMPRSALVISRLKQKPFCPDHLFTCDCHGEAIYIGSRWASPYEPERYYCLRSKRARCSRCQVEHRRSPDSQLCSWCMDPLPLVAGSPFLQELYKTRVKLMAPWFSFMAGVTVSGNDLAAVFEVSGVFKSSLYRYDSRSDTIQKLRG